MNLSIINQKRLESIQMSTPESEPVSTEGTQAEVDKAIEALASNPNLTREQLERLHAVASGLIDIANGGEPAIDSVTETDETNQESLTKPEVKRTPDEIRFEALRDWLTTGRDTIIIRGVAQRVQRKDWVAPAAGTIVASLTGRIMRHEKGRSGRGSHFYENKHTSHLSEVSQDIEAGYKWDKKLEKLIEEYKANPDIFSKQEVNMLAYYLLENEQRHKAYSRNMRPIDNDNPDDPISQQRRYRTTPDKMIEKFERFMNNYGRESDSSTTKSGGQTQTNGIEPETGTKTEKVASVLFNEATVIDLLKSGKADSISITLDKALKANPGVKDAHRALDHLAGLLDGSIDQKNIPIIAKIVVELAEEFARAR